MASVGPGGRPPLLSLPVGERDHRQGSAAAPITLVEYGDYQCPSCRQVVGAMTELQATLGDRLQFVFRHMPLSDVHPQAQLAAEAAEAAAAQGAFWEMHARLFASDTLDEAVLLRYAAELGLDVDRFRRDLGDHRYAARIDEDIRSGLDSGVSGTPTFFVNGERYDGAWDPESLLETLERPLGLRLRRLAAGFASRSVSSGLVLLLSTLLALAWANSPWRAGYVQLWDTTLAISLGGWTLSEHLLAWVNDGLMVIFFLVVGLEIKRELTVGALASPRRAALPLAGALGGMLVPAALYMAFNRGGPAAHGWGIPMATDIAFTLGILTVLGSRVPASVRVLFAALAIADDLGAVLVIALFYSTGLSILGLGLALVCYAALLGLNRARVYRTWPYAVLGVGLWLAVLESGVHPTIAGVLLATAIPTRSPPTIRGLLTQTTALLEQVAQPSTIAGSDDSRRQDALETLETITDRMQSPAQRLENTLEPWSTYVILPIFALANAGITLIDGGSLSLLSPLGLGIIAGLVLGKPLGISAAAWLAVRSGLATKPDGVRWRQIVSVSCLAGIGFTISLFLASTAFADPALAATAKLAILVASVLASVLGCLLVWITTPAYRGATQRRVATPEAEG